MNWRVSLKNADLNRWVPEHTHIPASRRTPHPAEGSAQEYWHSYDPSLRSRPQPP
ncbi:MAG: hypothetical protein IPJ07_08980 [Acidobacteria bacterium]|nr:hypothetical protein [Acidobacteriota bacterium]